MENKAPNSIAHYRAAAGLSQQELAEKVGAHWVTISKLERGKMQLTVDYMRKIGDALDVPAADLMALPPDGPAPSHGSEPKDQRIPIMMTRLEVAMIDNWMFANRIRSRAEAIRRLCAAGLEAETEKELIPVYRATP